MAELKVELPKMGESVAEATITTWLKAVGDKIEEDEPIVEIATDKVDSEVPSPCSGELKKILFQEGDVVEVGAVFAVIETENGNSEVIEEEKLSEINVESEILKPLTSSEENIETKIVNDSDKFYSPLVKSIASKEGVSQAELDSIKGSGANDRVTKKDILNFLSNRSNQSAQKTIEKSPPTSASSVPAINTSPNITPSGNDEIVEMDRMRKMIAEHMVMSVHTAPHVTSFVEADVTNLVLWRNKTKKQFEEKEGEKLTFTPIFVEAVAKALRDYPMVNSSINGDQIIVKKNINIGMATALPSGNLIVPVIGNADQLNMVGLAKKVNDLAKRARENKLKPDEISGGTYTISNVGTFGNVMGTPIINQPQSGILALGAIRKKPAVIETPTGDTIGIRHMMFLSHSYDHRVVNGALGGLFIKHVADLLENWSMDRKV